jgi:protein-tyrosine phosphatase
LRFCDLHSHFLPGLDDGAPDPATTMAMLRALADLGFSDVTATPHQKPGQFLPSLADIDAAYTATTAAAGGAGLALAFHLAAENMWDDLLHLRADAGEIPSYDRGRAFLYELPLMHLPPGLPDFLFRQRRADRLPVLAHPERYEPLWHDLTAAERLAQSCALLVDLPALAGRHGRQRTKPARRMIEEGIAQAVATDCHSPDDVRDAAEGMAWIKKRLGERALDRLLADNPRRIVAGELPD